MRAQTFPTPPSERALSLTLAIGLHVAAGAALLTLVHPVIQQVFEAPVQIQLVTEAPPQPKAQPEPPRPVPVREQPVRQERKPAPVKPAPTPAPQKVIQSEAPAPAAEPVMTAPPPREAAPAPAPEPRPAPAPAPAVVQEPRHDADYLHNPKPAYPRASISLAEEGVVTLRVQVSEDGKPLQVQLQKSSGFVRLDRAAQDTVRNSWRFVPGTVDGKPVTTWVNVPVRFTLNN